MKNPKELRPVVKRLSRSPSAVAVGGGVDTKTMAADGQKMYGSLLALDRDFFADHAIGRLIGRGNAAAADWLSANVVDENAPELAFVKTERRHK